MNQLNVKETAFVESLLGPIQERNGCIYTKKNRPAFYTAADCIMWCYEHLGSYYNISQDNPLITDLWRELTAKYGIEDKYVIEWVISDSHKGRINRL